MNSPQFVNTHSHHHHNQNHHHSQQQQQQPQQQQHGYGKLAEQQNVKLAATTTAAAAATSTASTAGVNAAASTSSSTPINKFAPARRLAARQTLRLAIPKQQQHQQQGDSSTFAFAQPSSKCNSAATTAGAATAPTSITSGGGGFYRHSPSQLPPAPILKRSNGPAATSASYIPKSASPLESHNLPNVTPTNTYNGSSGSINMTPSTANSNSGSHNGGNSFLSMRKPTLTLNSSDIRNNNDLFAFAKDMSPAVSDHSPIFADIASSMSPGSGSPPTHHHTHQLGRLFSLSPSSLRNYGNMSDFSDSSQNGVISPATSLIENFHKKNGTTASSGSVSAATSPAINGSAVLGGGSNSALGVAGRHLNTSASSSLKETSSSSTSQQVVNSSSSSSTTTRVEKKSQRMHHITSSSSSSSAEMKAAAVKRDLSGIKSSMSEINDLALDRNQQQQHQLQQQQQQPSIKDLNKALNSADAIEQLKKKIRSSIENLVDSNDEPIVTLPDDDDHHHHHDHHLDLGMDLVNASAQLSAGGLSGSNKTIDTVKFEEKRTHQQSKTKVVADGFSSEQATSNSAEMKRLQAGDIDYKEAKAAAATRNRLEVDGVKTEENAAVIQEALSLRTGDITQQASNNVAASSIKVQSENFSADKKAISQSQQSQTMTSNGIISQEKHMSSASQSNYSMTHKGISSTGSSMISSSQMSSASNGSGHIYKLNELKLDDLKALTANSCSTDIEKAITKYSNMLNSVVNTLQDENKALTAPNERTMYLDKINEVIQRAWAVPTHGHELGYSLCNSLRKSGGLDLLMKNCVQNDLDMRFSSAKLLEQCLTTENRTHVVDNGLDRVVNVACGCTKVSNTEHSRVGTGILEHLFKHSEGTCSDVIKLGGLDAVLFECRQNDVETLRHCASALANLSLYGGAENQEAMIYRKVPMWLFPLAFHDDDNIKYYACLAIAVLVANKEIEAEVLKSGCLDLVEPFVTTHDPYEFARSNLAHAHGQSKHWLERLVPVLSSNREEARNLAAFHFCMEAGIKREQGNTEIFKEIGAIQALKTVASCPNAIASKFAAQALRLIGETVPHKLSQQVPLWSVEDVQEWVKQIGFVNYIKQFEDSQVDGDLLLKLNQDDLRNDVGISNGILLKRFERELQNLKRMADYSSKDSAKLHHFLAEIGPEYCTYTYAMLNAGIDKSSLPQLNEDMLATDCGIKNSIHRLRILTAVKHLENSLPSSSEENMAKTLDVFVSYRRSNGSQLASLLKVHLQLRGFSVFIDVERLEAGKFDNGLLNSIRQAKNFVLVLTPDSLRRCINDEECKDWVHREIVAALNSNCNIVPILDQHFAWPKTEELPEDMRSVTHFNGVNWIHDYQDACIDKLERFLRGEKIIDRIATITPGTPGSVTYQRMTSNDSDYLAGGGGGGSVSGVGGGNSVMDSSCSISAVNGSGQAANHQANRYRQSPSPARQRVFGNVNGNASGGTKRNILPPYRTQQPTTAATIAHKRNAAPSPFIGGSMQNVAPLTYLPPRRSSAAGICNQSNSVASNYRSHSVDGLLETNSGNSNDSLNTPEKRIAAAAALVAAGSSALANASSSTSTLQPGSGSGQYSMDSLTENMAGDAMGSQTVARREKSLLAPHNTQHRKSRSLDHILGKQARASVINAPSELTDETQSMQNLAMPLTPNLNRVETNVDGGGGGGSGRDSKSTTPERSTIATLRHNFFNRQSPEGVSSTEDEREDSQSIKSNSPSRSSNAAAELRSSQTRAAAHVHRGGSQQSNKTSSTSLGAASTNSANNKTIFNRTMKKVRSLIKNNELEDDELPGLILSKATSPSAGRMIFW